MNWRVGIVCLGVSGTIGCSYATGAINYSQHPELKSVTLYSGHPNP